MEKLKASDLRIGNLVYDSTGNTTIVESIVPEHERVRFGIPLNEEWLVKFGFQRSSKTKYHIKGMTLVFHINSNQWIFGYTHELSRLKKVHYVHQIQNIYHALTGGELTIK